MGKAKTPTKTSPKPYSAEEEERLSQKLIQKMLREEARASAEYKSYELYSNSYADEYEYMDMRDGDDVDDDDDYRPSASSRARSKRPAAPSRRANAKAVILSSVKNEDEENIAPKRSSKTKQTTANDGRKKAAPKSEDNHGNSDDQEKGGSEDMDANAEANEDGRDSFAPEEAESGKQSKASTPGSRRAKEDDGSNKGLYTDEEERLFLEGLEKFGRGWKQVANHIGTRNSLSVRSHAQKYFIRLYRDKLPLPAKVKESGDGYTLSGKPLDPNSASARPYLSILSASRESGESSSQQGVTTTKAESATSRSKAVTVAKVAETVSIVSDEKSNGAACVSAESHDDKMDEGNQAQGAIGESPASIPNAMTTDTADSTGSKASSSASKRKAVNQIAPKQSSKRRSSPERTCPPDPASEEEMPVADRSHLRRAAASRTLANFAHFMENNDMHTMVACEPYAGPPGSNIPGAQPFSITVESAALLTMDVHAHLMNTEIIGFLAGKWTSETKHIQILEAFPCKSLSTGMDHINVEMDPSSEIEVRRIVRDDPRGLRIVGWYHSHPNFRPDPSIIDLQNQSSYQALFACEDDDSPFVGAIVGPYDPKLPDLASAMNWFYVSQSIEDRGRPKHLTYTLECDEDITMNSFNNIIKLVEEYASKDNRVDFSDYWNPKRTENKLQKLLWTARYWMPWIETAAENAESSWPASRVLPKTLGQRPINDGERVFLDKLEGIVRGSKWIGR